MKDRWTLPPLTQEPPKSIMYCVVWSSIVSWDHTTSRVTLAIQ